MQPLFDELAALGRRAPYVLLLDGGDHSYWHNRKDGPWGTETIDEAIPAGVARARTSKRPLWIDLGTSDPFREATLAYAKRAGVTAHVWPGGHDAAFWNAHTAALLRFFARACA